MKKAIEYVTVCSVGAVGYTFIEVLWRGYSHWTMAVTGGLCLAMVYLVEERYSREALWKRCLAGSLIITVAELAVGFVVNMLLGWNVWDYSDMAFNVCGQICALYFGLWFLLCIPCVGLCAGLRRLFDGRRV